MMSDTVDATSLYATFWIGSHHFGLEVQSVREILTGVTPTSVPRAEGAVSGILNLRGQIVTVIDLATRLELESDEDLEEEVFLVVEGAAPVFAIRVDRVGDVMDLDANQPEAAPSTLPLAVADAIVGVSTLPTSLLQILDPVALSPDRDGTESET
ncbi:MAG: chemotaxis protein CheW [Actinomycetota bacterium]